LDRGIPVTAMVAVAQKAELIIGEAVPVLDDDAARIAGVDMYVGLPVTGIQTSHAQLVGKIGDENIERSRLRIWVDTWWIGHQPLLGAERRPRQEPVNVDGVVRFARFDIDNGGVLLCQALLETVG